MTAVFRTSEERVAMADYMARERDRDGSQDAEKRQNRDFVQVYPKGWERMRSLVRETRSQAPLLLYTFIAEHIDRDGGVVVADQETICEAIGISRTTLWRAITFLEERNAILRLTVGGSVSAYALDPSEIWKDYDASKERSVFRTKTIVRNASQSDSVKRRMQIMMKEKRGEPELPLEAPHDPTTGEVL